MRKLHVILVTILAILLVPGVTKHGEAAKIYGCYHKKKGNLRIIKQRGMCKKTEKLIVWNTSGPQGSPGTDGADGLNCWDLNENGTCDTLSEDKNLDGICDVDDCQCTPGAEAPGITNALCELYSMLDIPWPIEICGEPSGNIVFVSSSVYNGDLGGVEGADTICQGLAEAAGLSGTYKAWISDSTSSPATSFTKSTNAYRLPNGLYVADNWVDLTDMTLRNPISYDEYGVQLTDEPFLVWTGTHRSGVLVDVEAGHCNNWTHSGGEEEGEIFGVLGNVQKGVNWSYYTYNYCNLMYHLYCFEQSLIFQEMSD